jgi:VWFA-related protein
VIAMAADADDADSAAFPIYLERSPCMRLYQPSERKHNHLRSQRVNRRKSSFYRIIAYCTAASACIISLVIPARTQSGKPAPSPEGPVFKVSSQMVLEDVSVSDSHGNPVHDLKPDAFKIFEDGKPQTLRNFEEHSTPKAEEIAKFPPMPKLAPSVFTNYTPAPVVGAVNVVLLDTLNTPLQNQAYVRSQLLAYIKNMKPGTRVAIFGMNRELHLLQGFTSDPSLLLDAMTGKKGDLHASTLMESSVGGDLGADTAESDAMTAAAGNDPSLTEAIAGVQQFEAEQQAYELEMRALYTLDGMNQLARYLAGIPGRKNLIWFSASFPIDLLPNGDLPDPFAAMGDSEDEFRETVTLLARSHVAVFPVDARGLMVNPAMNAENTGMKYSDHTQGKKDTQAFFEQTASEHSTMLQLADKTGGKAFINTNGLKDAVEKAVEAGSNYYSLSYYPPSHKWDGKYHSIEVKLDNPKLKLTYRIGYYADDPDGPPNKRNAPILTSTIHAVANVSTSARASALQAAMQFGAPEPTQIVMKLRVVPLSSTPEDVVAAGNIADPKTRGPYQRYAVDYAADTRHIQFTANPDGTFKVTLEFAVLVYDDQGKLYNSISKTAGADNITATKKTTMLKNGMQFHQEISVPVKGHYFLRAGIHDRVGDTMGAVELDMDRVKAAAQLAARAATATPQPDAPKPDSIHVPTKP